MAHALTQAPLFFYSQPTKPRALNDRWARLAGALRKFAQGAGTPILAYSGLSTASEVAGAPSAADFATLDGFTLAVLEGRLTGPAQLIAGALLFLAAGRCTARLVGLVAGAVLVYLYMNGATAADGLSMAKEFTTRIVAAFKAFESAGGAA